jgi:hypothetical protein
MRSCNSQGSADIPFDFAQGNLCPRNAEVKNAEANNEDGVQAKAALDLQRKKETKRLSLSHTVYRRTRNAGKLFLSV